MAARKLGKSLPKQHYHDFSSFTFNMPAKNNAVLEWIFNINDLSCDLKFCVEMYVVIVVVIIIYKLSSPEGSVVYIIIKTHIIKMYINSY